MRKLVDINRGFEFLDDPALPPAVATQSLKDIALANTLFGGTRAVLAEARETFAQQRTHGLRSLTLLDVGAGLGNIPLALRNEARRYGIQLQTVGLEITHAMAVVAQQNDLVTLAGDARALPFPNQSIDVITCSLVLHHLDDADALLMLRECSRVAKVRVIVSDLRRSWLAIVLLWLVSFPLRFHSISRHDGMLSIRRGYTVHELRTLIQQATQCNARCVNRIGWRITASWNPVTASNNVSERYAPAIT